MIKTPDVIIKSFHVAYFYTNSVTGHALKLEHLKTHKRILWHLVQGVYKHHLAITFIIHLHM